MSININIWDDYDDQKPNCETVAYIEGDGELTEDQKISVMRRVMAEIMSLPIMAGAPVKVELVEDRIAFTNLSHELLESFIEELETKNLSHEGMPINIYSES